MKRKNIIGMLVIAVFVISIVAALMQYKKEQMVAEKPETGEEADTIILGADENPFGMEIKKLNENYDLTKNYYKIMITKDYRNLKLQRYIRMQPIL